MEIADEKLVYQRQGYLDQDLAQRCANVVENLPVCVQ